MIQFSSSLIIDNNNNMPKYSFLHSGSESMKVSFSLGFSVFSRFSVINKSYFKIMHSFTVLKEKGKEQLCRMASEHN